MSTGARSVSDTLSPSPLSPSSDVRYSGCRKKHAAAVLWDNQNCIPLDKIPSRDKPVLLLTPVVVPPQDQNPDDDRDPFEVLGQLLSKQDIPIRHVPYTKSQGITGVHVAFIRRARAVIFVLTGFQDSGGALQPEYADLVAKICESQPLIVVCCCDVANRNLPATSLRTVVQATGYSNADLQATASILLLNGDLGSTEPQADNRGESDAEPSWSVQPWDAGRDLAETHALWLACIPRKFHLDMSTLGSLLNRDGYALHYAVREPQRETLVGFCATYTTYVDGSDTGVVGSIAVIIVRTQYRGQGIGSALYNRAAGRLRSIWGIQRMQLGTIFPRLLCGLPVDITPVAQWFEKRGWLVEGPAPALGSSKGRTVTDWVLRFSDLPGFHLASAGLVFKRCDASEAQRVLDLVGRRPAARNQCFGWYDQYARTLNSGNMGDIVVGFEGSIIVATAITYVPGQDGPSATDIPWPGTLGSDLGGVTCICITDDVPEMANRRDTVMVRLLHTCSQILSERGMTGMFLDGVQFGEHGLGSLGFRKWAEYKEVWQQI